jgi:sialate O-acetylesterase
MISNALARTVFTAIAIFSFVAQAEVRLPSIVGSNMVMQRDQPVPIWGWDEPGTEVSVTLADTKTTAKADDSGKWIAELPAFSAGGPYEMLVVGSSEVKLDNLLFGDVWFCSGQSNMEWRVSQSLNAEAEIAGADFPRIRHIKIPHRPSTKPESDVPSDGWMECQSETVAGFTGVGYFFARHLQDALNVPIGLIGCNWGGTRIEPWTPPIGFQKVPALSDITDKLDDYPSVNDEGAINHQSPLALYNGMVSPIVPFAIRGVIWYQGEANRHDGMLYYEKMKALIEGWRQVWQRYDLPFHFVQLAPYRYDNSPLLLPAIWEAQVAALSVPNTGMAVTLDIGNLDDIHPKNKQEVGRRLALSVLARNYNRTELVYSGPLYRSMRVEGNAIRITFDHVGGGLVARDGEPLNWFTIAGDDKVFVEALAEIDGDAIVISSAEVENPVAVRFAWHQEAEPNLANKDGLPASAFRTHNW